MGNRTVYRLGEGSILDVQAARELELAALKGYQRLLDRQHSLDRRLRALAHLGLNGDLDAVKFQRIA